MHKKKVIVSRLPDRLPNQLGRRVLLSRETIRKLTSEELSQVVGGGDCPTTNSNSEEPNG